MKDVENSQPPPTDKTLLVEDGNAIFYCLKEMPAFYDICIKVHNVVLSKCDAIFSTDMYKPDSVKVSERPRRGRAEKRMIKEARPKDYLTGSSS